MHHIINRQTLKLSYSCTANMSNIIAGHNAKILTKNRRGANKEATQCNCQKREFCPTPGRCEEEKLVYEAMIETPEKTRKYIGSTELSFKKSYFNHTAAGPHKSAHGRQQWRPVMKWNIVKNC